MVCFSSLSNLVNVFFFLVEVGMFSYFWSYFFFFFLTKRYGTHSMTVGNNFLEFRGLHSVTMASHKKIRQLFLYS